jgi:di/tricarboxylate transporter
MIALWTTTEHHGFSIAVVTICGALAMCAPGVGAVSWKKGLGAVSWTLVIFTGGALALGQQLIDSGLAAWIADRVVGATAEGALEHSWFLLVIVAAVSITSHLYIPSHAVRATVLIPPLLAASAGLGLEASALAFIASIGIDYCLTFPVSSKAFLLFVDSGESGLEPADLVRVSAIAMPIHLGLMVLAYHVLWVPLGLGL